MAQTIQLKRSATAGNVPSTSDLALGEVGINTYDGKLYIKKSVSGTESIVDIGSGSGYLPLSGGTLTGNLSLGDNVKLQLGNQTNGDLQIYHDGSHSYIDDTGTGHLFVRSNGDGIYFRSSTNEEIAHFNVNGSVKLYHDNSPKLATTATGIDVTGTVVADGIESSGNFAFTAADGMQISAKETVAITIDSDDNDSSRAFQVLSGGSGSTETLIVASEDAGVNLYYDNSPKIATTSTGIDVTGTANATNMQVSNGGKYIFGGENTRITGETDGSGKIRLFTGGTEKVILDGANVGIGLTNPSSYYSSSLVVDAPAEDGITIVSPSNAIGYLMFADGTSGSQAYEGYIAYNHLNNYLHLRANDHIKLETHSAERMRIDSSGNLYCSGGSGGTVLTLTASSGTTSGDIGRIRFGNNNIDSNLVNIVGYQDGATNSGGLKFETQPTGGATVERMRIDSSGNLLVGTTSNSVYNDASGTGIALNAGQIQIAGTGTPLYANRQGSYGDIIDFRKDGTTVGSIGVGGGNVLTIGQGSTYIQFHNALNSFYASDGSGGRDNAIDIGASGVRFKDLYLSGTVTSGRHIISGSHSSTITTPNIDSYGALSSGTAYNYHIMFKQADGTVRGQITNNIYGTQYTTSSDYRLKENVQPLSSSTNRTLALNPCTFEWIDDADNNSIEGFLAHEVAAIVPEAVVGAKDALDADGNPEYQTIDQSKLIPILVKTIQELEARITALENA